MKKSFKLDKEREFLFNHPTACAFETGFGDSLLNAIRRVGPLVVNYMVWATLRHNWQDRLTREQTETLVQKFLDRGGDMQKLVRFLSDGWTQAGVIGKANDEIKTLDDLEREAAEDPADEGKEPPPSAPDS